MSVSTAQSSNLLILIISNRSDLGVVVRLNPSGGRVFVGVHGYQARAARVKVVGENRPTSLRSQERGGHTLGPVDQRILDSNSAPHSTVVDLNAGWCDWENKTVVII